MANRKVLAVLILGLFACSLWAAGPIKRKSGSKGPGFAPMQRGGAIAAVDPSIDDAVFRTSLVLEFLPANWHLNAATIDIWYDTSGYSPARNATQTTALEQPGINNGVASFTGAQAMYFPAISGADASPTITLIKFTAYAYGDMLSFVKTGEETLTAPGYLGDFTKIRFYASNVYAFFLLPLGADTRTQTRTFGLYSSPSLNKVYSYSPDYGIYEIPSITPNVRANWFTVLGSGHWAGTPTRQMTGAITSVWQWNHDPGLTTFAQIASIAAAYNP